MEIQTQIFYTTTCSCLLSLCGSYFNYKFVDLFLYTSNILNFNAFYQFDFLFLAALIGLVLQGQLLPAIDFMFRHPDCFYDVAILSSVS